MDTANPGVDVMAVTLSFTCEGVVKSPFYNAIMSPCGVGLPHNNLHSISAVLNCKIFNKWARKYD